MGRIGYFVNADNPGASEAELLARDRLAHELMYFSRGNPVVYYGDEQGFTGTGGDQVARQTMFASQVPDYLDDDLLGTTRTHARTTSRPSHPLYTDDQRPRRAGQGAPGAAERCPSAPVRQRRAGIYAFSRILRGEQREYVVALNNSESAKTAAIPTYVRTVTSPGSTGRARSTYGRRRPAAVGDRAGPVDRGLQVGAADSRVGDRPVGSR